MSWALLDLPTEILLIILKNLHECDLFSISLLSRRLHYLALPLCLLIHGVAWDSSTQSCRDIILNASNQDTQVALRSALFIKSIHHLEFRLADYSRAYRQLHELNRLVSNSSLLHILEFTLDLSNVTLQGSWAGRLWIGGVPTTINGTFQEITRHISQKSCEAVTIRGGRLFGLNQLTDRKMRRLNIFGFVKPFPQVTGWNLVRTLTKPFRYGTYELEAGYHEGPFDLSPLTVVKTLHIQTPVITRDPFLKWVVMSINFSPLTTLTFSKIYILPSEWSKLLRYLTAPTLTSLSFAWSNPLITDIVAFLSRHPSITNLNIFKAPLCVKDGWHRLSPTHSPSPFLYSAVLQIFGYPYDVTLSYPLSPPPRRIHFKHGNLTSLSATPEHVAYLMAIRSQRCASHILAGLTSLSIESFDDKGFGPFDCALDMLSRSSLQDITLTLRLYTRGSSFVIWLRTIVEPADNDLARGYWESLRCVKALHLQTLDDWRMGHDTIPLIPCWLAKLPSVERVTFSTSCFKWIKVDEKRVLEAKIRLLCPQMRSIDL